MAEIDESKYHKRGWQSSKNHADCCLQATNPPFL